MISKSDQCHNYILTMKNILVNICNTKSSHGSHCTTVVTALFKSCQIKSAVPAVAGQKKKKNCLTVFPFLPSFEAFAVVQKAFKIYIIKKPLVQVILCLKAHEELMCVMFRI